MAHPNMLYKIFEYRLLSEDSEDSLDSDYFFIQYLTYILTYIDRDCITDFGFKSVEFNIKPVVEKFRGEYTKEQVTQQDLIDFCLYMSNSNKICNNFLIKISLYKQNKDEFRNDSKLPDCVLDDFIRFEDRICNLSTMFNKVVEIYSDCLGPKHKSIYNTDKHRSFITA
jgi:hypothetical protein